MMGLLMHELKASKHCSLDTEASPFRVKDSAAQKATEGINLAACQASLSETEQIRGEAKPCFDVRAGVRRAERALAGRQSPPFLAGSADCCW